MVISDSDYQEIIRHFNITLQAKDPEGYERLINVVNTQEPNPKKLLLDLLAMYAEIGGMRSESVHLLTLNKLRKYVSAEKGDIQGIHLILLPEEQELYKCEQDYIDLTPVQDFSKFRNELYELYEDIKSLNDDDD